MKYFVSHFGTVAALGAAHLAIVLAALAVALAIALPLGIVAARGGRGSALLLGALGAIYTIPSLALLALLVQGLGLGIAPLFVALVAYAQFMLVRNVVAGLRGVDAAALDAGRGLGMSPRELLVRVEFPLALPSIVGGIRIAGVAMVALATLGGYIGAGGLGSLIFNGLALQHDDEIVAGSLAACMLAIAIEFSLRALERKLRANQ